MCLWPPPPPSAFRRSLLPLPRTALELLWTGSCFFFPSLLSRGPGNRQTPSKFLRRRGRQTDLLEEFRRIRGRVPFSLPGLRPDGIKPFFFHPPRGRGHFLAKQAPVPSPLLFAPRFRPPRERWLLFRGAPRPRLNVPPSVTTSSHHGSSFRHDTPGPMPFLFLFGSPRHQRLSFLSTTGGFPPIFPTTAATPLLPSEGGFWETVSFSVPKFRFPSTKVFDR